MVPQVGIEPTYPTYKDGPLPLRILRHGAEEWSRTTYACIFSAALYR